MAINTSTKRSRYHEDWKINFSPYEKNHKRRCNDPIVIFDVINNFGVDKILVNDGSVVEVLIYDAFKKMNLDESLLRAVRPIYGFTNQSIKVKGLINLPITLGTGDNMVTKKAKFLIINQPLAYNTIISRPL